MTKFKEFLRKCVSRLREPKRDRLRFNLLGALVKAVLAVILIIVVTGSICLMAAAVYINKYIDADMDLSIASTELNYSTQIYAMNGSTPEVIYTLHGEQNREWVDYDDIPRYLKLAVPAIEDERFWTHRGVDWKRTMAAAAQMMLGFSSDFGGSTITQQLIKNITGDDDVTVQRKIQEILRAMKLEETMSKEDILELYLNTINLSQGCYGVQTAAKVYFGKDVSELTLAECASIAGITNLPSYYDPFVYPDKNKSRQEYILWAMYEQGYISKQEYNDAIAEELDFVHGANEPCTPTIYSYYEEVVISDVINDLAKQKGITKDAARLLVYNGGYQIYSCIDTKIQKSVDSIYENYDNLPQAYRNTGKDLQSGIVLMDQRTGEVKALSGGCGEKTINFGLNRATETKRPTGSSIKGIAIYGPAVEYGLITPSTWVYDGDATQITLSGAPRGWYPNNDSGSNAGLMTISQALTRSVNTVSAQILDKLTPQASYDFLKNRLGITSLEPEDCSFAPLALGQQTYGITVREMCAAYASFANDGVYIFPRTYTKVLDSEGNVVLDNSPRTQNAFSASTAHVMTYMLNHAATYGTGSESRLSNMPTAGKTGTSTNYRDRWFCGYTPYYTAAVWTGFDIPEYMPFSGNPAVQIWHKIMELIHADLPTQEFVTESGGGPTGIFGSRDTLEKLDEEEEEEEEGGEGESTSGESSSESSENAA